MPPNIAILGTGPAGLYLASLLARKGFTVRLFDPKTPWETSSGTRFLTEPLRSLPLLEDFSGGIEVGQMKILSARGSECLLSFPQPLRISSREEIQRFLRRKAKEAGVILVSSKVEGFEKKEGRWILRTREGDFEAHFLVGADGASSFIRRGLGVDRTPAETIMEVSLLLPQDLRETPLIRFLEGRPGFFWFSSQGGRSVMGLWTAARFLQARNLFDHLERMAAGLLQMPVPKEAIRSAAQIPSFRKFVPEETAGDGWTLIGEAARLVDPITADGIFYGLTSAAFFAASFDGTVASVTRYLERLKTELIPVLRKRRRLQKIFYMRLVQEWVIGRASRDERIRRVLLKTLSLQS